MSATGNFARRLATTILIGMAFSWAAMAHGGGTGDNGTPKKGPAPAPEPAKKVTQTRVFTPKYTDPAELLQAIDVLLESVGVLEQAAAVPGVVGGLGGLPGAFPGAGGQPAGPGVPGAPQGGAGIGGAGIGGAAFGGLQGGVPGHGLGLLGFGGMIGGGTLPPDSNAARLALDKRTGSVIIRGPEKEVQIATDLVKLLDNPPGKPLPEVKSLRAFPLKHTKPSNIASLANEVDIGVALLPLDEAKLLVAVGPPEALREVVELVSALDAAVEKRPDTEKRRKLFAPDQEIKQRKEAAQ